MVLKGLEVNSLRKKEKIQFELTWSIKYIFVEYGKRK